MADYDNTVDLLGDDAFSDALILKSFTSDFEGDLIDDQVVKIGSHALEKLQDVKSAYLPYVTLVDTYGFAECKNLESVDIPMLAEVSGSSFNGCSALTEINFPELTKLNGNAFQSCTSLTSVTLPKVTSLPSYVFNKCTKLTNIDVPNVKYVYGSSMSECTALKRITLPACISFVAGLMECTALEVVNLPVIQELGVNCFSRCSSLKQVNIGPTIQKINTNAFTSLPEGCVINLPFSEGAIEGAPWAATKATINYDVTYVEG